MSNLIQVKTIEHTIAPHGGECITQQWTYPRSIHAEVMTHRVLSRNAESSRAVPVLKKLELVEAEPWVPEVFTKNKKGMQGGDALEGEVLGQIKATWLSAFQAVASSVRELVKLDVHKQYANRLAEPWATITVVVTATEWDNIYALRTHPTAMPEFQELAWKSLDERYRSLYVTKTVRKVRPINRSLADMHLPYVALEEREQLGFDLALRCSVARCARVSYLLHDGTLPNVEKDSELYYQLLADKHMSPFEHQASPMVDRNAGSGNFRGFRQYRQAVQTPPVFDYWQACAEAGREPVIPRPEQ